MAQHEDQFFYIVMGLALCSIMAENTSVANTTQQRKYTAASQWLNFIATIAPTTHKHLQIPSAKPPPVIMIEESHSSVAPPPAIVISEPLSSAAPPPIIMIDEPHSSVAPPPAIVISELLSSTEPPPAIMIDEPHSSVAPPPAIVISELLSSAAPPPAIMIDEPHSSVASPPGIVISEPLNSAAPPPSLIMIELRSSVATPPGIMKSEPFSSVASPPSIMIKEPHPSAPPPPKSEATESRFSVAPLPINSPTNNDKEVAYVKYDLNHLQKLCPLNCTTNQRDKQKMKMHELCCLPCKCDAMCKKLGNCCEKSPSHGYMCHSTHVEHEDETNIKAGYFMIDTCLNDSRLTDCSGEKVAPWGTLYPVYDRASDLNFYNHLCAECNGAYNYLFWDLNLEAFTYERSLTTCLNAMSEGRHSDCRIGFTPPKEMNEIDHVCSLGLVSSCNVTGRWLQYDADLEQACASMFSPVLNKAGLPEFANVYCALCNGVSVPDDVCFGTTNTSDVLPPLPPIELGSQKALSMLLEYETVSSVINSPPISGTTVPNNGKCGKLMVKHPTKEECRAILCPNGYFRNGEECVVLSNNWNKFLYFIQLILTPVDADLPSIHFLISEESTLQPPELWFDTHIAPLDYFKLYAKIVEYENTMYTEKLLVRVGRLQSPLDIAEETKMIRDAMSKTWTINLKNRTFSYTAKFDKYADFVPTGTSQRYDVVHSLSNKVIFENGYPPLIYDLFLRKEDDTPDVVLKKTHFCERVRLSRSEWEGGFQEIRLYLDSEGHTTELGDSEFDIFTDDDGRPTVEICLDDFNPNYEPHLLAELGVESGVMSSTSVSSYLFVIVLYRLAEALRGHTF